MAAARSNPWQQQQQQLQQRQHFHHLHLPQQQQQQQQHLPQQQQQQHLQQQQNYLLQYKQQQQQVLLCSRKQEDEQQLQHQQQQDMSHLSLSPPSTLQSPSVATSSCTSTGCGACGGSGLGGGGATPNEVAGGSGDGGAAAEGCLRLGSDLEALLERRIAPELDYSDADLLVAEGVQVPVHRCILAARSPFFRRIFAELSSSSKVAEAAAPAVGEKRKDPSKNSGNSNTPSRIQVDLGEIVKGGKIGRQCLMIVLGFFYGGKLSSRIDESCGVSCMDVQCPHLACWPVVEFYLELLFTGSVFDVAELKSIAEQHLLKLVPKAQPETVVQILAVATCQGCEQLQDACVPLVATEASLPLLTIQKSSIPKELVHDIINTRRRLGLEPPPQQAEDKLCTNVYKALDCDDIELMSLLLKEADVSADAVCALHYAASYCDVKTFGELVERDLGDINLKDRYGYTVLHAATLRRDPQVIGLILAKGAYPLDTTPAGFTALQLSRRIARNIEASLDDEAAEAPREDWLRDKICVEILEQAGNVNPCPVFPVVVGEKELFMRLLYLENRVAFARLLWPREAKVVLGLSQVEATKEFIATDQECMDLNKEPSSGRSDSDGLMPCMNELVSRVNALQRAIEVGHRFFPRCTAILNQYMDDGSFEHACIQNRRIPEEQLAKRKRVSENKELKNRFAQAFQRDVEDQQNKQFTRA